MKHDNQSPNTPFMLLKILFIMLFIGGTIILRSLVIGADPLSLIVARFLGGFIDAIPFLLLGVFTSGLIEVLIKPDDINRWLPQNQWARVIGAVLLGFLFPVGEWGIVPVTRRLFTKGIPVSMGIALLLTAPIMNPIVFASTIIVFGFGAVFIGRIVLGVIVAIVIAIMISLFAQPKEVLQPQLFNRSDPLQTPSFGSQLVTILQVALDDFFVMVRYLIAACLLSALLQTLLSHESLPSLGQGHISSGFGLQIQAFIVSVSATSDSTLAMTLRDRVATGSIISFLSFGAMIDIKSALMFTTIFQRKIVVYMLILAFLMNLLAGVMLNLFIGS